MVSLQHLKWHCEIIKVGSPRSSLLRVDYEISTGQWVSTMIGQLTVVRMNDELIETSVHFFEDDVPSDAIL